MRLNEYDIGDGVTLSAAFATKAGVATDPTTVTVRVKNPAGTVTDYVYGTDEEVVRDSDGAFHLDVLVDASGTWYYRCAGTGAVQAAAEGSFTVRSSQFS